MKTLNTIFALLAGIVLFNAAVFAQNNHKPVPQTETMYSSSGSTGDLKSFTSVKPQETELSPEKKNLLTQLEDARASNNIPLKEQLESELNKLNRSVPVKLEENSNVMGGIAANSKPPYNNDPDYMSSTILTAGIWSSAMQTESAGMPHPGRVWVATGVYGALNDTCRIYFSDNNGQTWTYGFYFYLAPNVHFRTGELDLELVYDGSVLWIYGVAGYSDAANRVYSLLFRFNTTANTYSGYTLLWPGNATTTNKYYNPRIVSDNSSYTASSYIYVTCSFDSADGSTHYVRQKYAHVENPFVASPAINYAQTNANNGGFFWYSQGLAGGAYLWQDIGYFKTSASLNRIITVYNIPASNSYNLYMAWSDDYGATITGSSSLAETNADYGAKISFNGGATNYNGMIAYVRQYVNSDWDSYCRYTTDGGSTWTSNYIDGSTNRTRTVDLAAPRGAANLFKVAYTQDSAAGPVGYYTGGNGAVWNNPPIHPITSAGVDTTYTKIVAGYTTIGGDDCLSIYSIGAGTNLYASRLCQTTLGNENTNNGVPKSYSLAQNYPNPFNPTTNINFSIPKTGMVKLVVYDITGKAVATLVNEQLTAGNYKFDFDASNLSTGVYLYKLEADGFSSVKKMVLVK